MPDSRMTSNAEAKAKADLEAKITTWRSGRLNSVSCLLVAVDNAATVEIVRAELNRDAVAGEDADEVFAHAPGDVSKRLMLVLKLNLEHRIWQGLNDDCHHFDCIFLRQTISFGKVGG
jgi:4-diphosphocytidyl-2C-methyl-D-erythritol kinase